MALDTPLCWNLLDDHARAVAHGITAALPAPLHELGVDAARAITATQPSDAPPTPVDVVETIRIPTRSGDVGARVYRHTHSAHAPALLYLHGGGFILGTLDGVDELCRTIARTSGWTVVSLEYRLAPEHPYPAALDDALDAFAWLHESAATLGIDSDLIAVGGDSAGGNLTAATCLDLRERGGPRPAAQVLIYPAVDDRFASDSWTEFADAPLLTTADAKWCFAHYVDGSSRAPGDVLAAPMRAQSLRGLPPAIVITAEVDPIRDDAEAFAARLHADDVEVTAIRYPGVFHGFVPEVGQFAQTGEAIDAICAFLAAVTPAC
ncbi:alpha/beta hydrolase [Gordonia sp. TBRC 11910]|uniref:Alpha/beta hydrolase n=1 Tax=Gordonia asplenii TaxID=2725283 RepID=A0A848L262_9ACTN|nr:alpha/beta hydrolase [Gordonia asplenii]NMO03175.1 alpha/beta hydrolase [Gordonia asplenii]